jgi:CAAX prenyl protease-like protein
VPFAAFAALTLFQGDFGPEALFWIYLAKTILGAWLVWVTWPIVQEMRWKFSWAAVAVGIAVLAVWVGLEGLYPRTSAVLSVFGLGDSDPAEPSPPGWNPHLTFGQGTTLAWFFIVVRLVGSSLVVPPLEEVFYRSFLYRSLASADFEQEPLGVFRWMPFLVTSIVFGISHQEWLPGILCGFAYQGLTCWKNRLGDAMVAHAITNALLAAWVVTTEAWHFW